MCAKERGMAPSPFAESDDEEDYWDKDGGFMGNDDSDSSAAKAESGQDENSAKDQKPDIVVSDFVVTNNQLESIVFFIRSSNWNKIFISFEVTLKKLFDLNLMMLLVL